MPTKSKPMGKFISVRVTPRVHYAFHKRAAQFGRTSDLLRELIDAVIEDRIVIQPNPTKRSLYHVN